MVENSVDRNTNQRPVYLFSLLACGIALLFAIGRHYQIFEPDLFTLNRYGDEILATGRISAVNTWSDISYGATWYNTQWIPALFVSLLHRLDKGFYFFPTIRSLLLLIFSGSLSALVWNATGALKRAGCIGQLLVLPLVLTAIYRFELRAELFNLPLFVLLLLAWMIEMPLKRRVVASTAIVILWANVHGGTVPIGILVYATFVGLSRAGAVLNIVRRLLLILLGGLTWFLTPITFHAATMWWLHFRTASRMAVFNIEWRPLSIDAGPQFVLWSTLLALTLVAYFFLLRRRNGLLPPLYREPFAFLPAFALLVTMFVMAPRTHAYVLIFSTPVLALGAGVLVQWRRSAALVCACGIVALVVWNESYMPMRYGFGPSRESFPTESVKFIKRAHLKPNMLNGYDFGGYLASELREYRVSMDGRCPLFLDVIEEIGAAETKSSGEADFEKIYKKYNFNFILWPLPAIHPSIPDQHAARAPSSRWAIVFMDNASIVYAKRIPEHAALIRAREYKLLYRGVSAALPALSEQFDADFRKRFEAELDRCLSDVPDNIYCLVGKAAFYRRRGQVREALQTMRLLPAHMLAKPTVQSTLKEMERELW